MIICIYKCTSNCSINVKRQKSLGDTFIAICCIESDRPTHSHVSEYLTLTLCAVSQQSKARSTVTVVSDVCKDAFVCTATVINTTRVHYTHTSAVYYLKKQSQGNFNGHYDIHNKGLITTTGFVLWPFVWDYPGEPVTEETYSPTHIYPDH